MSEPLSPAPSQLDGRLLGGRYRLGATIANGGMAQVRRASDEVLGREVAVKILHPHLATDPAVVDRFRHEAVAAARLTHPAIVSIYDTVSDDGVDAIVMELVEGITLREYLDQTGPLDERDAVDVVAGVADALQTAHEAGIVHRDVKPANILLCEDRRVMVADFGIAKAAVDQDLTQAGTMVGTAKYLAPEQVRGERVDPRTDVYALGVVLYECLCGRPPFEGDSEASIALARLHRDPLRPRQVRPSIPRSLDVITMQCLSRDPDERPPTAAALRAAVLAAEPDDGASVDEDHTRLSLATVGEEEAESFVRSERRWIVPTLLVVLVGGALLLAGALVGRTDAGRDLFDRARQVVGSTDEGSSPSEPAPVEGLVARAYDPFGGDGENDAEAPLAVDGDPATAWETEHYSERTLTSQKDGVGLVVELPDVAELERLVVRSSSTDWAMSVFVAESASEDFAGWGEPVAQGEGLGSGETSVDLDGASAGAALVWITDLGPGPPGELQVDLAEVSVLAR